MFQVSSDNIEEITTSVSGFIYKCINDVVPTVTVCMYLSQKPWITDNIHTELKARAAASKEWKLARNPATLLRSNRQSVNTGLRWNPDTHQMWQGLQTITKETASLPDKLNAFYARFEPSNTEPCM